MRKTITPHCASLELREQVSGSRHTGAIVSVSSQKPFTGGEIRTEQGSTEHGGSHLESQYFGRPRWVDRRGSGVGDQPGQLGETPALLKMQK